jgi:hypothetical protein
MTSGLSVIRTGGGHERWTEIRQRLDRGKWAHLILVNGGHDPAGAARVVASSSHPGDANRIGVCSMQTEPRRQA